MNNAALIRDIVDRIAELLDQREVLICGREYYRSEGEVDAVIYSMDEEIYDWDETNGETLKALVKDLYRIAVEEDEDGI